MDEIYIIALIVAAGVALNWYLSNRKPKNAESLQIMLDWMKDMKTSTEQTRDSVQKSIHETNRAVNERLDNAGKIIAALTRELGGVAQIGPDIRRLTETLASPKLRGNFGEEMLENLLGQVLPKTAFVIQHRFKNGETVDAIIKIGERNLSIDSKFSMENYRLYKQAKETQVAENLKKAFLRDVRKRVEEIHKKYILPQEDTYDFALMFIPSEGVYMEVAEDMATVSYARDKKVVFVGPNTLYLTLQTFLVSLRGQQINKAAQEILSMIAGIKQESDKFGRTLEILSTHVKNTNNTMDKVGGDYQKLKGSIHNAANLQLPNKEETDNQQLTE